MYGKIKEHLEHELAEIKAAGLYKNERIIESPQRAEITVGGRQVLNFCANNYLGLSDNPRLIEAAKKAMDARGYGMSSVRFICGCQDMHKQLEKAIADYSVPKTRFSMPLASTPTAACSNLCLPSRMRSSPIRSTMRRSSRRASVQGRSLPLRQR